MLWAGPRAGVLWAEPRAIYDDVTQGVEPRAVYDDVTQPSAPIFFTSGLAWS